MELNSVVYPAPEPTSDANFFLKSDDPEMREMFLLVNNYNEKREVEFQIPCIYMENRRRFKPEKLSPLEEELRREQEMIEECIRQSKLTAQAEGIAVNGNGEEEKKGGVEEEKKDDEDRKDHTDRVLLYFHGNAEDLFHNLYFLQQLKQYFGVSVLAMEYPGYGFFAHKIKDGEIDKK